MADAAKKGDFVKLLVFSIILETFIRQNLRGAEIFKYSALPIGDTSQTRSINKTSSECSL